MGGGEGIEIPEPAFAETSAGKAVADEKPVKKESKKAPAEEAPEDKEEPSEEDIPF